LRRTPQRAGSKQCRDAVTKQARSPGHGSCEPTIGPTIGPAEDARTELAQLHAEVPVLRATGAVDVYLGQL